jgi:hypothetical protein
MSDLRIYSQEPRTGTNISSVGASNRQRTESGVMDAKYNYIIDSMKWRIALNLAGFAVWLAATLAILRVAG